MQYTIRNVPKSVDRALRKKAKADGKSLNEAVIDVLSDALVPDASGGGRKYRDLSDVAGTMTEEDAQAINAAVAWMDEADLKSQRQGHE